MSGNVVVLTGGVGGAKLVLGCRDALPEGMVTAIVNTGDDFRHLDLAISPDIDTLLYTLAGKANPETGWGRSGETWSFMAALASLGGPEWFQLGDGDLAVHVLRTLALRAGERLSAVTARMALGWQVGVRVLPMSDEPVHTILETDEGALAFQEYFVARRAMPKVSAVRFSGGQRAHPAPGVIEAILDPATRAILIAPSNPFLSIDPILAVPGLREALRGATAPVVAVSPLIGGEAVKGPTAKLMREMGLQTDVAAIARHYQGVIDGLLIDERDAPAALAIAHDRADTMMIDSADRIRVARAALALADRLR